MSFFEMFASQLQKDQPLGRYTAARLGGTADWLYVAHDSESLITIVSSAWAEDIPVRILGGGANVLIGDKGYRGLIVINHVSELRFDGADVHVSGGYSLTVLARKCASNGLSGFEWAVSVPGTVGGAVVNNAGAHGGDIAGNLVSAEVLFADEGQRQLSVEAMAYAYRSSALKARRDRRYLVVSATLRLDFGDPAAIQARMDEFIAHRKRTQPAGASLGSIFKNPPGDYAGRLIESCGLKGYSIGGAQVSPVHANFFLNHDHATARDYFALIEHVRSVVHEQTGVMLETEIECIGEF
ncbi:UDP-N-acetylmuramate dehydrogenase [Anaerolineae bacterium CFX9]|jgi:UDP-N-acetylmuramate dehydrogenase|nr:UDP-N-acetylmuramate dehydrogenase [Anaerolineae bacterium CFX9]